MNLLNIARAAEDVVACTGGDCTVCSVLETVSRVINFLMAVSAAAAVLALAVAGFIYLSSAGKKSLLEKAKDYAQYAVIGFILVITGWLVIRTALFVYGYRDAASFWRFECATGVSVTPEAARADLPSSLQSFPNLVSFVTSGEKIGRINGPLSTAGFLNPFGNLKTGEELTFSLAARDNAQGADIQIPFLAGYKDTLGKMMLDDKVAGLFTQRAEELVKKIISGDITLIRDNQLSFSDKGAKLVKNISSLLIDSKGENDFEKVVEKLNNEFPEISQWVEKSQNPLITPIAKNLIAQNADRSMIDVGNGSRVLDDSGSSASGSDGTGSEESSEGQEGGEQEKGDDKKVKPLDPGDKEEGSGVPEDVKRALRRLEKRDYLRYEMFFRGVKKVHIVKAAESKEEQKKQDQETLGDPSKPIKIATAGMKIYRIAEALVHEATHGNQDCLGLYEDIPKAEAIACANEIGVLNTFKPRIEEFPRQPLGIFYNGLSVRGHLARYSDEVSPMGDLEPAEIDEEFDHYTKYPVEKGGLSPDYYRTEGVYQYGRTPEHLRLAPREEQILETIMKQKGPIYCKCGSCPPSDLPKLRLREPCNCQTLQISVDSDAGER